MISGNLEIYLRAKEENIQAGKKVYGQGIFADNILLNGGTIKEEYQNDTKDISILAETKDGICEGIVLFANNDFVGNNSRIIFIIPGYDNKIKLHSENKSVNVNSKNIVYLDSSNIKDLKASLSQTRYDYDGKEKKPEVNIKGLINGVDYECKYVNNVNPGKPFVRVSGINMFKGVVDLPFEIVKKATKPAVVKEEKKTDTKKTEVKKTDKKEIKKGDSFIKDYFKYKVISKSKNGKSGEVAIVSLLKKNVKKVVIPKNIKKDGISFKITRIESNSFKNGKKLKKIIIKTKDLKNIGNKTFSSLKKKCKAVVPKGKKKAYKKMLKNSGFKGKVR